MDRLIYLSMAGAKATMQRQEVLAHNLANASTTGFRAEMAAFRAVPVRGDGASTRVYALETTTGYDAQPGVVQSTGRPLDVAMRGHSWLAVQGLDGTEAYTRAGALATSADGTLVTADGLTVLGDGGPITVPPNAAVSIAPDGTVSAAVGQRHAAGDRPAQAGDARRRRSNAAPTACSASPKAICRPTRRRASKPVRSKARTSARSRRWSA